MPKLMIELAGAQPLIETPAGGPRKEEQLLSDPGFAAIFAMAMAMGQPAAGFLPVPTPTAGQSPVDAGGLTAAVLLGAAAAGVSPAVIIPGGRLPSSWPVAAPPATPAPAAAAPAAAPGVQTGKPQAQLVLNPDASGQLLPTGELVSPNQVQQPPTQVQQPPNQVQQPPTQVQQPPIQIQQPPTQAQQPPTQVQQPPTQVQQPPTQVQQPPNQVQQPPNQVEGPPNQVQQPPNLVQQPPNLVQPLPTQVQAPPNQALPPNQVLTPNQQVAANQLVGPDQPAEVNRQRVPPTVAPDREQEKELAPPPIVQGGSHGLRLAAEFSPVKTDPSPAPAGPPQTIDQVMERVAQVVTRAEDGTYTLTLRLHPEELGEVRLHLVVAGREIQTLMSVQNPAAQQALTRGGEQLRQSLDQAGYALTGFQVSTGEGGGTAEGRQQARDAQAPGRGRPAALTAPSGPAAASVQPRIPLRPGGLDTMA